MTNELINKAKECKSAEELLALAKENNIEMTAEEAAEKFAALNNEGELSDDELDSAAGGGCGHPDVGDKCKTKRHLCGKCGGKKFRYISKVYQEEGWCREEFECLKCGEILWGRSEEGEIYTHFVKL